jgi:hypothetical protein
VRINLAAKISIDKLDIHILTICTDRQKPTLVRNMGKLENSDWLDDRGSRVQFPVGAGNFSLHHRVQTGSGAHPASYPMDTRGSFPGGKEAGA